MNTKRTKAAAIVAGLAVSGLLTLLGPAPDALPWQAVHLSVAVKCDNHHSVADVTAANPEASGAHVLAQTGGAWAVGDVIPASPDQTKHVTITGPTSFSVRVNYPPADTTARDSNVVTASPITGCVPPTTTSTTKPPTPTTKPPGTTTSSPPQPPGAPQQPSVAPPAPATPATPSFTG